MRDSEGALVGFSLPPLPFAEPAGYRRLAPSWPTESDRNIAMREDLKATVPGGTERVVVGFLRTSEVVVLTGQTRVTADRTHAFVEFAQQVARDIEAGYRYVVERSKSFPDARGGSLREDLTVSDGTHLVDDGLVDEVSDDEPPWAGWWDLCEADVSFYWSMRRPS